MRIWFATFCEGLRANFWFIPTLMVIGATVLALGLLYVDNHFITTIPPSLSYVYQGGADGAQSLLSTLASSVIGVAGTTFSITIAALTLASTQFGPRLLNNFVRDRGNQFVLGTYIATFTYCLLVLRTIRSSNNPSVEQALVPHISVTVAVLLSLLNLGVLIYFINHIAITIQINHVIATIGEDITKAVERLFPEQIGMGLHEFDDGSEEGKERFRDWFEAEAYAIQSDEGGYVQFVDTEAIMNLAKEHDVIIHLLHRPGDYVIGGSDLAFIYPAARVSEDMAEQLNGTLAVGPNRTKQQDIQFSIDQLVEVAVRALSPAINDPFTAITCVNELGEALCRLAQRRFPSSYRYDEDQHLRVIAESLSFKNVVDVAFDKIRNYAGDSTAVTLRMMEVIAIIMKCTRAQEQRAALQRQADMILRGSEQKLAEEQDRADVAERHEEVLRVLNRKESDAQKHGSQCAVEVQASGV
ncbi:MAG TPA: DUF2254 domain-containing protein [Roseiflexaceae bacterium]|nr:DUF2254 domain-containing protein [Roseiflexaceae bacterium]